MKQLYIDCTNGISSDMLLMALVEAGGRASVEGKIHVHEEEHHHGHSHSSYMGILHVIEESDLEEGVKAIAKNIYGVIAKAEAKVHGETLETVHFHEVGRPEAIVNIISIAQAVTSLGLDEILCSDVHDGHGEITCSHGVIPVPVPAVKAMMGESDYTFVTDDIETEMVTPSGLGVLMGIGAKCVGEMPEGFEFAGRGIGTRDIGRDGLKVYLKNA